MHLSKKATQVKGSSTLQITAKSKRMIAEGHDIIAFTAGEPDFPTPQNVKNAAIKAINDGHTTYTAANGLLELREAICDKLKTDNNLNYSPDEIVVSNGAKHSLANTFAAILNPGDEVLVSIPFWLSYKSMIEIADGVPVFVQTKKENSYKATIEELESHITPKTKAILINSPANPTGSILDEKELEAYANFAKKHDLIVISDEIYEYLIYSETKKHVSIATLPEMKERTIVINGFSKSYAMTGWRVGYTAGPKDFSKAVTNVQSHTTSNPNTIAQYASLNALLQENELLEEMVEAFTERRDFIYENISKINGLSAVYPEGAFYLYVDVSELFGKSINGKPLNTCVDACDILLEDFKVCSVPCRDFGSENHLRLSFAISKEQIAEGVKRIEQFANSAK